MSFTKITQTELNQKGAMTQPDRPTISAQDLKRVFDAPAKEVVAPAYNRLIDELEATTGAASLGAAAPTGRTGATVQAVINSVSGDLATLEGSVAQVIADDHTHANKALLDTYDQTNADITTAVTEAHTHSNKALLDTYTQTETDIADAVSKKHDHSNKSLLDTYTQTETDLADAVSKKHAHTNLALLETYTQTETDLAQAVADDHTHSNKTVLDKFGESSGNPTYDGNPIGGGGSGDTFKTIESAGTSFVASGEDTFKINAGSNVTITALSGSDKGIQISATGGGSSTGDMLMSDYDNDGDVKTAGGIDAYVGAEIAKLDGTVSGSAGAGNTLTAFSQTDGKVSATFGAISITKSQVSDFPTIPTVDQTYSSSSTNAQSGTAVASAISGKADTSSLGDLAYIDIDGSSSTKVLQGDGTWVTPSTGGHDMIDNTTLISSMASALSEGTSNDDVVSAYGVGKWSNVDRVTIWTTVAQGDDTIGVWNDGWKEEVTPDRTGWIYHSLLAGILTNNNVDMTIEFDPANEEVITLAGWRIDDSYTYSGNTVGCIAIKLNSAVKSASGVKVGVVLDFKRTEVIAATTIPS